MEQLHFDTNIYGASDSFQYPQQLQPAYHYQEDPPYELNNSLPELSPIDLEANQEFFNVLFLQNQMAQAQQLNSDQLLITPTEEFFALTPTHLDGFEQSWFTNDNSSIEEKPIFNSSIESRHSLSPEYYFEIKTPFLSNPSSQQSTLLKSRSKNDSHKSLNEVANGTIGRSRSTGNNPFYTSNEHGKFGSPLKLRATLKEEEITKLQRLSIPTRAATPKVNNNFIREYNNKKISKFIKGTKKTNKGYKNFINYKCTGDNFERDEKVGKEL